jgi:hypothetical protein
MVARWLYANQKKLGNITKSGFTVFPLSVFIYWFSTVFCIPHAPCIVYIPTKLGDFVRANVGLHIPAPWWANLGNLRSRFAWMIRNQISPRWWREKKQQPRLWNHLTSSRNPGLYIVGYTLIAIDYPIIDFMNSIINMEVSWNGGPFFIQGIGSIGMRLTNLYWTWMASAWFNQ